jgi:tetratricopeptide (TPR) repeat protein
MLRCWIFILCQVLSMRHAIRSFFVFVLLSASFAASAQNNNSPSATEQARKHLKAGGILYDLGYYQESIDELEAAYKLAPLSAFFYNLGLAHRRLGDLEKAKEYFTRFIDDQSQANESAREGLLKITEQEIAEIDALLAAPTDGELRAKEEEKSQEELRKNTKKWIDPKKGGLLVVVSKQSPVRLILNGGAVQGGLTPYAEYLNPNKYVVEITADGYEPFVREVVIDSKKPQILVADLVAKKARLTVLLDQDNATIKVDGKTIGKGSKVGPVEIEPGARLVQVHRAGYKNYQKQIALSPGEEENLEVTLQKQSFLFTRGFQYGVAGASVASLGASAFFGVVATQKTNEANDLVADDPVFNDDLQDVVEEGEIAERRQIITMIVGGAGLALGGTLFVISRKRDKAPAPVAIDVLISPSASAMLKLTY